MLRANRSTRRSSGSNTQLGDSGTNRISLTRFTSTAGVSIWLVRLLNRRKRHFQRTAPSPLTKAHTALSRKAGELAEAFHFVAGGHGAVLLHHGAHLQVLLEDDVDVLHRRAAAFGDALASLAVNNVVVAAFLVGHGVDDGFDAGELASSTLASLGRF